MQLLEAKSTRREFLTAVGLGAVSFLLSACGDGGDGTQQPDQPQLNHGTVGGGLSATPVIEVGNQYCETGEGKERIVFRCNLQAISK